MAADKLTPKQQRFIDEYLVDANATQAAIRAGYSERSAHQLGHELYTDPRIRSEIERREQERSAGAAARRERAVLTKEYVIDRLIENVERAMEAESVVDREGNATGLFRYDGHAANGALKLLGLELGMFKQRVAVELPVEERRRRVMSLLTEAAKKRKAAKR